MINYLIKLSLWSLLNILTWSLESNTSFLMRLFPSKKELFISLLIMHLQYIRSKRHISMDSSAIFLNWDQKNQIKKFSIDLQKAILDFALFSIFWTSRIGIMLISWSKMMEEFSISILLSFLVPHQEESLFNLPHSKCLKNISKSLEDLILTTSRNFNLWWSSILLSCWNARRSCFGSWRCCRFVIKRFVVLRILNIKTIVKSCLRSNRW